MDKGEKRSTPRDSKFRSRTFVNSDTIPQPKGEFRDLFRLMQDQKSKKRENSTQANEASN